MGSRRIIAGASPLVGADDFFHRFPNSGTGRSPATATGVYTTVGTSSVLFKAQFRLAGGSNVTLENVLNTGLLVLIEVAG